MTQKSVRDNHTESPADVAGLLRVKGLSTLWMSVCTTTPATLLYAIRASFRKMPDDESAQLFGGEGFGEIVVGPEGETAQAVFFVGLG